MMKPSAARRTPPCSPSGVAFTPGGYVPSVARSFGMHNRAFARHVRDTRTVTESPAEAVAQALEASHLFILSEGDSQPPASHSTGFDNVLVDAGAQIPFRSCERLFRTAAETMTAVLDLPAIATKNVESGRYLRQLSKITPAQYGLPSKPAQLASESHQGKTRPKKTHSDAWFEGVQREANTSRKHHEPGLDSPSGLGARRSSLALVQIGCWGKGNEALFTRQRSIAFLSHAE